MTHPRVYEKIYGNYITVLGALSMSEYIVFGVTYAFACAVQPGPLFAFLISQTLRLGWRHTLPAAFSPILSDIPIVIVVLFALSRLPSWFGRVLQIAGGLLLLYLAFQAYRRWRRYEGPSEVGKKESIPKGVFQAALVNILNPGPYLGWGLIMGPLVLKGWRETPINAVALVVTFYTTMVVCLAGIIVLFGVARNLGPRVVRVLIAVSVVFLAAFGCYQLWMGIRGG
jgi:threonine/homoserine/homoserine lactone efflux protein